MLKLSLFICLFLFQFYKMDEKCIFLLPDRIQRVRYKVFIDQMKKNNFNYVENITG